MAAIPKRHHYVSEMILTGFTDGDGWLHWCRLNENPLNVRRARPRELFHKNHLYSTVSKTGIKNPAMEAALSSLETEAAPVVKKILSSARAGRSPNLSSSQKRIWNKFLFMQWRRTPESQQAVTSDAEALDVLEGLLGNTAATFPDRREEIAMLSAPEARARILRNARVGTLRQESSHILAVLERRGIAILRIVKPDESFIIGSRPVVKLTPPGRADLDDPVVELWLPIASDVAAGVGLGDGGISLQHLRDAKPIRQLNTSIASQSNIIAARSPALVRSLIGRAE